MLFLAGQTMGFASNPNMGYPDQEPPAHRRLALSAENVHWGYFSKSEPPKMMVTSGETVTVEMASHHACDDYDKMVLGDSGMESVFEWSESKKGEVKRGATGTGDGVHVMTGPIYVEGAMPGDILAVEIVDLMPRPNKDGKTYGSNAAAWWGFQARSDQADGTPFDAGDFTDTPGSNDEVITIYEIIEEGGEVYAELTYQFGWPTLTDPEGTTRNYYAYPGTCVPHDYMGFSETPQTMGWTKEAPISYTMSPYPAKIPINMHVGCMGLAPASHDSVDSIPPMPTGGNLDDKRIGKGTTMYYPVEVAGALLSMGDAHAAQGDGELDGTAIETSITGKFKITVHKKASFSLPWQPILDFPLGETADTWIIHGFTFTDYLEEFAANPGDIYSNSDIDLAMHNAYTQTRKFLMATYSLTNAEADTIITQGVDFGMTQLVDGNWGVHAVVPKAIFSEGASRRRLEGGRLEPKKTVVPNKWAIARKQAEIRRRMQSDKTLTLSAENVHWGYFSKLEPPKMTISSGETVTVEMASHHACDDYDKMVLGDSGMESVFEWSSSKKGEERRGATGGGDGVHVMTGPIYVEGAMPGDILAVEIVDLMPRPNKDGKTYGSNAAAWWGFQARSDQADGTPFDAGDFTDTPGSNDEVITIYEIIEEGGEVYAELTYQFGWPTLTDPEGTTRNYYAYPGTCVPHDYMGFSETPQTMGWTKEAPISYTMSPYPAKIPINMHVGCMGLAPSSHDSVDSIPPMPTGGNLDDKRIGKGTTMYYPVEVAGALLSMGDAHAAQGDGELDGTAIETSITGKFKITVHKKASFSLPWQPILDFPLGETADTWIIHGFTFTDYLEEFAANPGDIYSNSDIDLAMHNAYTQTRKFLMATYSLTNAEADTIITQGVDFGMTQLVDGNWGVHAVVPKSIFAAGASRRLEVKKTGTSWDKARKLAEAYKKAPARK